MKGQVKIVCFKPFSYSFSNIHVIRRVNIFG